MPDESHPIQRSTTRQAVRRILSRAAFLSAMTVGVLVTSATIAAIDASAQAEIRPRHFTVDDGLPEESAFALLQDRIGFVWFGTQNGLVRYDGYDMHVYRADSAGVDGIVGASVVALLEDRRGDIWIGTGAGISLLDRQRDRFSSYQHDPSDASSISAGAVVGLFEDRDGFIWLTTALGGIDRIDPETRKVRRLRAELFGEDPIAVSESWAPFAWMQDRSGRIWVGADGVGVAVFESESESESEGEGEQVTRYQRDDSDLNSLSGNRVTSIHEDRSGVIWVGTRGAGLNRFDAGAGSFQAFRYDARSSASLISDDVGFVTEGIDGSLWVGSRRSGLSRLLPQSRLIRRYDFGVSPFVLDQSSRVVIGKDSSMWALSAASEVYRFHIEADRWVHMRQDRADPQMFVGEWVRAVLADETGGIWIGTHEGGIHRLDPFGDRFRSVRHDPSDPNSLSASVVRSIAMTDDGYIWIGTEGGGLTRFDENNQTAVAFRSRRGDPSSLSDDEVRSLLVDLDGRLWVGTSNGLNLMTDRRAGRFRRFGNDPGDPRSLSGNRINALAQGDNGTLWVGTSRNGLNRFDPATATAERFLETGPDGRRIAQDWVYSLATTAGGRLWVGTQAGISMRESSTGRFVSFLTDREDAITSLFEDDRERLWIGTYSTGIWLLDHGTGSIEHVFHEANGLPNNRVLAILGDSDGKLWVSTQRGLSSFDPGTKRVRNYDKSAGLPSNIFQPRAAYKTEGGRLFFGGDNGFTSFSPEEIVDDPFAPRVSLTKFRLAGIPVSVGEESVLTSVISHTSEITLAARQNDFGFAFAALHFSRPDRNQFQYQMEGYDAEWRTADASRSANYMNLRPGRYLFRVRAANPDGVWNYEGTALRIRVRPPWWRTWWAYSLYILVIGMTVFATDHFQRSRLIKRERQRARLREVELRAQAAESSSRALEAENARRGIELAKAKELAVAYEKLKATQQQLIQAEKLASLGELAAGIAHEIKNPLNFVNNFAEVVADLSLEAIQDFDKHLGSMTTPEAAAIRDTLQELTVSAGLISEHGKRADSIVRNMLDHSRDTASERVVTDISVLLKEYADIVYHSERAQNPKFECDIVTNYGESLPLMTVAQQELGRVFVNLLTNAFYATEEKKRQSPPGYTPRVELTTQFDDGQIHITVVDNGSGMPDDVKARIFEPFFTTKPTGTGTGLGLSLSYDIVRHGYGGEMTVQSEIGSRTEFSIHLPVPEPIDSEA